MKNPFAKAPTERPPAKFAGVGTVLISDIVGMQAMMEGFTPEAIASLLRRHLTFVTSAVEKHSGAIIHYIGNAVLAYWHPRHLEPSHAQLAFNASVEILDTLPDLLKEQTGVTYGIDIVLGTGEMAGDYIGGGKQFQVVGMAMAIADRLSKNRLICQRSAVRMSQYTADILKTDLRLEPSGTIPRANLEELRVFCWSPGDGIHGEGRRER